MYHLLVTIGLMGLCASFHGIILAAGRATFEFGRINYIPKVFGRVHSSFKTPANALLINMVIGIIALLTGKTGENHIMACFGALSLYILSMVTVLVLRKKRTRLERPFKTPFYPYHLLLPSLL
jgi:ethanolamine permease